MKTPQLYQPTDAEISAVTTSAKHRHPELATRADKAAVIIAAGLQLDATAWERGQLARWRIASQSGNGAYVVCGTSCPCQDKRAPYCKHSIAVALLLKVLANRINVCIRVREIELGILPDGTFNAYAPKLGHVHMYKVGSAYAFSDAASAVRYSMWTAKRDAVSLPITAIEQWPSLAADCVFA